MGNQTFRAWLLQQTDRDDPIGDLARDFKQDTCCQATSPGGMLKHMQGHSPCQAAEDAFDAAVLEWAA